MHFSGLLAEHMNYEMLTLAVSNFVSVNPKGGTQHYNTIKGVSWS